MANSTSRRQFLKAMAVGGAAVGLAGLTGCSLGKSGGSSEPKVNILTSSRPGQLRVAFIGTGGIGKMHLEKFDELGVECPCFCDVDSRCWGEVKDRWPHARGYRDYREMFDKQQKDFDAVSIAIPDHSHFPATVLSMKAGKAVYTQKPLTHTVWEARQLTRMNQQYKVATQMGNQGHGMQGWRITYEWIKSGAIGDVVEVHTWTNRPVWPQGLCRPEGWDPIPAALDWEAWIGSAPMRPFKSKWDKAINGKYLEVYHPFVWRGWFDFGSGALGDMACHTQDSIFAVMDPGYPTSVEPIQVDGMTDESFPGKSIIKWEFPARNGRPGFASYWYDGGLKPKRPADMDEGDKLPDTGNLYIGTKGTLLVNGDYGDSPRIIPEARRKQLKKPPKLLERSPGNYVEWVEAAKGNKPREYCMSNFSYAGPMTETILLGNVALRAGRKIEWDGANLRITNIPEANKYLSKEYRAGWVF
jgi:predicted dehydrogenase